MLTMLLYLVRKEKVSKLYDSGDNSPHYRRISSNRARYRSCHRNRSVRRRRRNITVSVPSSNDISTYHFDTAFHLRIRPRNPDRIPEMLQELKTCWEQRPFFRLGQLLVILSDDVDTFYVEDDIVLNNLREINKHEKNI